ncbi:MAG: chemotaxis protein [Gammaproteobacteria bacterium]|nr:chemotaxis protein [Gammaproteobacteria bacterium]
MTKEAAFVSSASMAAELELVAKVAKDMSISVKNAKAIANRAGAKARGFAPITDFIDEMSNDTMKLVSAINKESTALSRVAIGELRTRDAYKKFIEVRKVSADAKFISSLTASIKGLRVKQESEQEELLKYAKKLKSLMDDISQKMAVANVIVSNSRIEASNAEEYRFNLETIADDIDKSCDIIRNRVKHSFHRLENAMDQWKRLAADESNKHI